MLSMTYPLKFRQQVLETRVREGLTIAEVSERFCVGVASVVRWLKDPEPKQGRSKPVTKIDMAALAQDVRDHPDAYQHERAARFGVSQHGIGAALGRLGVTYSLERRLIN